MRHALMRDLHADATRVADCEWQRRALLHLQVPTPWTPTGARLVAAESIVKLALSP